MRLTRSTGAARAWLACALLGSACASAPGVVTQRDFAREGLADLRLRTVEVVVVVAGPPRISEGRFEVNGFPAPALGSPLLAGPEDVATRDALAREVHKALTAQGYQVMTRVAVATATAARTSSTATATVAPPALAAGDDLGTVCRDSRADAVLVVRAVPVDRFTIDVGEGTRWEETPLGRERVRDYRPVALEGRLLVGQAFLFDRSSQVRLWSRQAPDYPDEGRLVRGHPFLASGYVQAEGEAPAPAIVRATASARAFARVILAGLPAAQDGRPEAQAALQALDVAAVSAHDAFFDASHVALDVGLGWASETSELELTLGAEALPALGPGALTPFGLPRVVPRATWIRPGGNLFVLSVPLARAPSGFGRTYVRDNAMRTVVDADRAVSVEVGGVTSVGAQAELGHLFAVTQELFVAPRGGAFADAWWVDATPEPWADGGTRARLGLVVGADAWLRLAEPWYVRAGVDARVGYDTAGAVVVGGGLTLSAGLLL